MMSKTTSVQPFIPAAAFSSSRNYKKLTDSQKLVLKETFSQDKEWSAKVVRRLCKELRLSKATVRRWLRREREKNAACDSCELSDNLHVITNLVKCTHKMVAVYNGRRENFPLPGNFKGALLGMISCG